MKKYSWIACVLLLGCGGGESTNNTGTNTGGTGAQGGSTTTPSTTTGMGGGGTTGTGGTGGAPMLCPDPFLTYDPAASCTGVLGGLADRMPTGAAAGRFGPSASAMSVTGVYVGLNTSCGTIDPINIAVWTEPAPAMPDPAWEPATDPNTVMVGYAMPEMIPVPGAANIVDYHVQLMPPVDVQAGEYVMVAVQLSSEMVCLTTCGEACDPDQLWWYRPTGCNEEGPDEKWATLQEPDCSFISPFNSAMRFGIE